MKNRWCCAWIVSLSGGLACAIGSSPDVSPSVETAPSTPQPPDAASSLPMPMGDSGAAQDATNAPDAGVHDAGTDAGVHDAGTDAGVHDAGATDGGVCSFSGTLVTFDASALAGSPAQLAPASTGPGVTASPLTRVGVTAVSASGGMNAGGWPLGALDANKHFAFSVAPPAGCALNLSMITLALKASGSGPQTAAVATSVDGYGALTTLSTGAGVTDRVLSASGPVNAPIEVRISGYGAQAAGGTMRIDDVLTLSGALY